MVADWMIHLVGDALDVPAREIKDPTRSTHRVAEARRAAALVMDDHGLSRRQTAAVLGMTDAQVTELIRRARLKETAPDVVLARKMVQDFLDDQAERWATGGSTA